MVRVNGRITSINAVLEPNSDIVIEPSTVGEAAVCRLEELEEYGRVVITFEVNGRMITCPKFAEVNGSLEPPYYEIQENDWVEMRGFYTVAQIMEFMDVEIDLNSEILVNNKPADLDTQVYENFSVEWEVITYRTPLSEIENVYGKPLEDPVQPEELPMEQPETEEELSLEEPEAEPSQKEAAREPEAEAKQSEALQESEAGEKQAEALQEPEAELKQPEAVREPETELKKEEAAQGTEAEPKQPQTEVTQTETVRKPQDSAQQARETITEQPEEEAGKEENLTQEELEEKYLQSQKTVESDIRPTIRKKPEVKVVKEKPAGVSLQVIVNNAAVTLTGKASYVFVDVFDAISFDLNAGKGRAIVTKLNGEIPSYTAPLKYGDVLEIYWED